MIKKIGIGMLLALAVILSGCASLSVNTGDYQGIDTASPDWVAKLDAAKSSDQILTVAAYDEKATDAWIALHEKKADGKWHMVMTTPGFIGKNGLGKEKEGDTKTPSANTNLTEPSGSPMIPAAPSPMSKSIRTPIGRGTSDRAFIITSS